MASTDAALPLLARARKAALAAGAAGLLALGAGYVAGEEQLFQSYLLGFFVWLALTLGCLALTLLHHMVRARWGFPIIRFLEAGARTLPVMAALFLPILLFGLPDLYHWARPQEAVHGALVPDKSHYLNVPFFAVRFVAYFAFWTAIAYLLSRWSREEDRTGDLSLANKRANLAAPSAAFFVVTCTFAVTDWVMSLEQHWFSTIFGLLFVVGQALTALALATVYLTSVADRKPFSELATPQQWRDMGNLLLTLVILWAYMSFSQLLIIWSGNLPEEITYYKERSVGTWEWVGPALIALHFMLPFFLLLSSHIKRSPLLLRRVAIWILLIRLVDMFWVVVPSLHREGVLQLRWMDAAAFLIIGGIWLWIFVWQLEQAPLLPRHNPHRQEVAEHA